MYEGYRKKLVVSRYNETAELNRKDDNSRGLWMMTGGTVRAAINMG